MKKIFLILFGLIYYSVACSQGTSNKIYPEVGKPMPDFVLKDVQNFPRKQIRLKEFKGKWLILDWWTKYCAGCIASFPKIDRMQEKFKEKAQFVSIGYTGTTKVGSKYYDRGNEAVRLIFERSKKALNLKFPIAYDSTLYQKYSLGTTPYIVIIDPNGIVRFIASDLDSTNLNDLIDGKPFVLRKAYRNNEPRPKRVDYTIPFLISGNGGEETDFLYRSLLAKWNFNSGQFSSGEIFSPSLKGMFQAIGVPLSHLYIQAYTGQDRIRADDSLYGKFYSQPLLEITDASPFDISFSSGKGFYSYSLIVPEKKATRKYLMEVMQRDLKNYFDYDVSIETRKMPYWRLVASEEAKSRLKTKSDSMQMQELKGVSITLKKVTMKTFITIIYYAFQNEFPFIDETGIEGDIDLKIVAALTDFKDFKRALNENGLDLLKGEKEMRVLVLRDAKSQ